MFELRSPYTLQNIISIFGTRSQISEGEGSQLNRTQNPTGTYSIVP